MLWRLRLSAQEKSQNGPALRSAAFETAVTQPISVAVLAVMLLSLVEPALRVWGGAH